MDNKNATLELGTKPVGKLLAQYAFPAIIAMIAASLYNIVDRIFIGQIVGPMAISGLAITFPFINLGAAFGAAVGIGASTSISVKLGQRDYDTAENILGNTVTLNLIIGSAFGIICLIFLDPILRFFGASDATIPFAGYNYGSQQTDRLMRVLKLTIFAATGIMVTGWLIAHLAPYYCARMFTKDPELIRQAIKAIQINMMMYPVVGFQMVVTNFFQCIGKVKISIFLSLSRQLLFLIPLLVILPQFFNLNGVWASLPSSDFLASLVAAIIMMAYMRRLKKQSVNNQNLNS